MGIGGVRSEMPVIVRLDLAEMTVAWRLKTAMVVVMFGITVGGWLTSGSCRHLRDTKSSPSQRNRPAWSWPSADVERHRSAAIRLRFDRDPKKTQSLSEKEELAPLRPWNSV